MFWKESIRVMDGSSVPFRGRRRGLVVADILAAEGIEAMYRLGGGSDVSVTYQVLEYSKHIQLAV